MGVASLCPQQRDRSAIGRDDVTIRRSAAERLVRVEWLIPTVRARSLPWHATQRKGSDVAVENGPVRTWLPGVLVAAIVLSLAAFRIAFVLGAYHTVFYQDIFTVLVTSSVALVGTLAAPRGSVVRSWWSRLLLAAPAAWVIAAVTFTNSVSAAATEPLFGAFALTIAVTSVPYTVVLLARILTPGIDEIRGPRPVVALVVLVVVVAFAGWLVGRYNYHFLTCQDFTVAGDDLPSNCAQPQPGHGSRAPLGNNQKIDISRSVLII